MAATWTWTIFDHGGSVQAAGTVPGRECALKSSVQARVVDPEPDPDPYWIRIQLGLWIRIRIRNPDPDPDPGGQK